MREDILRDLQREIHDRCQRESNRFGMGCYEHIAAVVKNAEILAGRYGADREVVMIAAWMHDIASITDYSLYELHHMHGADMAANILEAYDYDRIKIDLVQACIRNHRGSVNFTKSTLEELCVADADAISHFDSVPSLLYFAYVQRKMGIQKGKEFVKAKLERSFQKLSTESKQYYQDKFEKVMEVLG
ncbi:MAG: HD domain-containing protein [Oscillospiraceae bacterium]|nr:HD domain-containing protein [Oscillospiraceae bacterium]